MPKHFSLQTCKVGKDPKFPKRLAALIVHKILTQGMHTTHAYQFFLIFLNALHIGNAYIKCKSWYLPHILWQSVLKPIKNLITSIQFNIMLKLNNYWPKHSQASEHYFNIAHRKQFPPDSVAFPHSLAYFYLVCLVWDLKLTWMEHVN